MTFVVVGFRVDSAKSVYYAQAKDLEDMANKTIAAFRKGAQFVSIRCVKEVDHGTATKT